MFNDKNKDELARKISKDIKGYSLLDILIVLGNMTQLVMEELPPEGQIAYITDVRKQLKEHIDMLENNSVH